MQTEAVIFDVDGTLWDTTDLVAEAWNHAVRDLGVCEDNPITGDILKKEFGKPMDVIVDNLFPHTDKKTQEEILKTCCKYEHEILVNETKNLLYPKVKETLKELSKTHKVCIVSNCQSGYIELFLEKTGLGENVTDIECFGDTGLSKGENIKLLMERNSIKKCFYVGDTKGDYEATVFAGIPFVFAAYGFGDVSEANHVVHAINEVLSLELL